MKKFLITLLILIVISGVIFFFGWVQFAVPPGQYGVLSSKTHGIDPHLVRSGEFRWVWYRLLPTNVKIAVFKLEQTRFPINYSGALPSGDTYTSFVGITNADFSWNLQGEIVLKLNPEELVSLATQRNLGDQEDLDEHTRVIAMDIELTILRELSSGDTDSGRIENIMSGNTDAKIERMIKTRYPEIDEFSLIVHNAKFPNFILYSQIRLMYEEFLSSQREFISSSFGRRAETHIENQIRFEELERYGDLLTRFPVLLEYLLLEDSINR
ncbi:MAG: hypothetical protein FWC21_05910 [Treponema sp.]|nr:hypothetical protein [Treponema sp.]